VVCACAGAVRALCEVLSGEEAALLNDRGINALMIAAFAGRMPVVEYLAYEGRLEIEVTDAEGLTCLHHGAAGGRAEVVRYLQGLDGAPSLVKRKTANGQTALHKAAMGSTPGHVECVQLLSGVAANQLHPMQPDNESMDVLLLAAAHGSLPVVQCLSKVVEVDMRAMSGSGQGVIHMAAMMGHLHVLRYLIEELGLDGNAPDNR
jgi:ankyrin repeat protein